MNRGRIGQGQLGRTIERCQNQLAAELHFYSGTKWLSAQPCLGHYVTIRAHEDAVSVLIRGEGVAACCCTHLLTGAGLPPSIESTPRPKVPAIMLGEATQKLLADVFDRRDLSDGLPRVNKRVVAWGNNSSPVALVHSAVVISD